MICLIVGLILFLFAYGGSFWLAQRSYEESRFVFEVTVFVTMALSTVLIAVGLGLIYSSSEKKADTSSKETSTSIITSTAEPQVTTE